MHQGQSNCRLHKTKRYLESGSEPIPHASRTSFATSHRDSSWISDSIDSSGRFLSVFCAFCIKRRLRVPLLMAAVIVVRLEEGWKGLERLNNST
jgi:hypothetical protein